MIRVLLICLALLALASPSRAATLMACQDANGSDWPVSPQHPCPTNGGFVTAVAPDASTVTTGGTAITAFNAGNVAKGGFITNPSTATAALCISISGTATTTSSGGTTCIVAGQTFNIPPMSGAVSANATDSGHVFSGAGYQ